MTLPAKPPRSVWVYMGNVYIFPVAGASRYDLHRPKRKPAKGKRSKRA